jgi:hypothetical protein
MLNLNMKNSLNFISSLSAFNKELFHSKAINWIFNEHPEFKKGLISTITGCSPEKITEAIAITEICQIDFLIIYKLQNNTLKYIHVENKIKASESYKKTDKYVENTHKEMLSQTEYYYERLNSNIFAERLSDAINIRLMDEQVNVVELSNMENWEFIFLKPTQCLENSLNHWRKDIWKNSKKNPWRTFSYEKLVCSNLAKITDDVSSSVEEYISFVEKEFTPEPKFSESEHLSFLNVEESLTNKNQNIAKISALEEWFDLLSKKLNHEVKDVNALGHVCRFETKFLTDTGNNSGFLIEACFIIPDFSFPTGKTNSTNSDARIGVQYEHNSNNGGRMKFFFAAHDYNNIKIANKNNYNQKLEAFLVSGNFKATFNFLKSKNSIKFNGCRTKSFCNKSLNMRNNAFLKYKSYDDLKIIFRGTLNALKDDLENLDNTTWEILKLNINKI